MDLVQSHINSIDEKIRELERRDRERRVKAWQNTIEVQQPKPEKLTCENCGAPLSPGGTCPYCGTTYKIARPLDDPREKFFRVEVERPGIQTLRAVAAIDNWTYKNADPEVVASQVLHQMTHQMADQLAAFIRFDKEVDPYSDKTLIQGTLRVVDPTFRW